MERTPEEVLWLEKRRAGLGGTDSSAIMGLNRYKGRYEVYCEKLGLVSKPIDNPYTQMGRMMEPHIARMFADDLGITLIKGEFVKHPKIEWLFGSLDYIIQGKKQGVDCKGVFSPRQVDKWGQEGTDEIPDGYYVQGQHYLLVTGFEAWHFPALMPDGRVRKYVIEPDKEVHEMILAEDGAFWNNNVLAKVCPLPEPTALCQEYIKARFSNGGKTILDIQHIPEVVSIVESLKQARANQDRAKSVFEEAKLLLQDIMGDADGLKCELGTITWKKSRDGSATDWKEVCKELLKSVRLSDDQVKEVQATIDRNTKVLDGSRRFLVPREWSEEGKETQ